MGGVGVVVERMKSGIYEEEDAFLISLSLSYTGLNYYK